MQMDILYSKSKTSCDYPVQFNNCGYYKNLSREIKVDRINGRCDYQIIFVINGKLTFENYIVTDGQMMFIPPSAPQSYTYSEGENTEYFWIHFTGTEIPQILQDTEIKKNKYKLDNLIFAKQNMFELMNTARQGGICTERLLCSMTESFLLRLFRSVNTKKIPASISKSVFIINSNPETNYSNEYLAKACNMSLYHFIRTFKKYIGYTPKQYQSHILCNKAKALLTSTDMHVEQIAGICGFDDPLYFSRFFKKHTQLSPTQYRNNEI